MLIKLLIDGLILRVISAIIYGTIFYWVVGLRASASAFTLFLGVLASFSALVSACVSLSMSYQKPIHYWYSLSLRKMKFSGAYPGVV